MIFFRRVSPVPIPNHDLHEIPRGIHEEDNGLQNRFTHVRSFGARVEGKSVVTAPQENAYWSDSLPRIHALTTGSPGCEERFALRESQKVMKLRLHESLWKPTDGINDISPNCDITTSQMCPSSHASFSSNMEIKTINQTLYVCGYNVQCAHCFDHYALISKHLEPIQTEKLSGHVDAPSASFDTMSPGGQKAQNPLDISPALSHTCVLSTSQLNSALATAQRMDNRSGSKRASCNCKKSKCLKLYVICAFAIRTDTLRICLFF